MPEHDGTGPKGRGPMTGRGRGHCMLKIPQTSNEPLTGFVGRSGQPVQIWSHEMATDLKSLHADFLTIETPIHNDEVRVAVREATPSEAKNAGS